MTLSKKAIKTMLDGKVPVGIRRTEIDRCMTFAIFKRDGKLYADTPVDFVEISDEEKNDVRSNHGR